MLYREIPFLRLIIALAAGILAAALTATQDTRLVFISVTFILLIIVGTVHRLRMTSGLFGITLCIFIAAAGFSLMQVRKVSLLVLPSSPGQFVLEATGYPEEKAATYMITTRIVEANGLCHVPAGNNMVLYIYRNSYDHEIVPGDIISTRSVPRIITNLDTAGSFNYSAYMLRKGYRYNLFTGNYQITGRHRSDLRVLAMEARQGIIGFYTAAGLSGETLALVSALTTGYRELLSDETTLNFSRAGIMHILAVSGLHVGILSYFSISLLSLFFKKKSYLKLVILLISIWTFAFITGLNPPVVRASLMFSILHAGNLAGRPPNSINSLLATAFILLVHDPWLIFDTGFLLSYSAVIYILVFYNDLSALFHPKSRIMKYIWDITAVSILAQLGTLPFVAYFFGQLPLLSLLSNLFAIPLAFLILALSLSLLLFSPFTLLVKALVWMCKLFAGTLLFLASAVASIPVASPRTGPVPLFRLVIILVAVALVSSYMLKDRKPHPHLVLTSLILCLA